MDGAGMDKVIVSTDVRKLTSVSISYLAIAFVVLWLGFFATDSLVMRVFCAFVVLLLGAGVIHNLRQISKRRVLFIADERGVTDYTKEDDVLFMPWERIERVELKSSNSNELMLDIVGFKPSDEVEGLSDEQRQALDDAGGKAFFLLELSGLWVSRSRLRNAFAEMRTLGERYGENVLFQDFKDPLALAAEKRSQSKKDASRDR